EQRAFVQILARMHIGDADAGAERRANRLALDDRLDALDLRKRDIALGACAVELHVRRRTLAVHALHAFVLCLSKQRLRLERFQIGLLDRDIERDEHRAGLDDLARLERHVTHGSGQFVAHRNGARRDDRADRSRLATIFALGSDRDRDRLDGLGLIRRRLGHVLERGLLPGSERGAGHDHRGNECNRSNVTTTNHANRLPLFLQWLRGWDAKVTSSTKRTNAARRKSFMPRWKEWLPIDGWRAAAASSLRSCGRVDVVGRRRSLAKAQSPPRQTSFKNGRRAARACRPLRRGQIYRSARRSLRKENLPVFLGGLCAFARVSLFPTHVYTYPDVDIPHRAAVCDSGLNPPPSALYIANSAVAVCVRL